MKKLLIAVDETKGSQAIMTVLKNQVRAPQEIVLLHVQSIFGKSLMGAMLGESEMATLKESLVGTDHQEALDAKAEKILAYYQKELASCGLMSIKSIVRVGNPAEEILKVAQEELVDCMILGCNGKSLTDKMICGSVTKEVERKVGVPVIIANIQGADCGVENECETMPAGIAEAYAMRGNK